MRDAGARPGDFRDYAVFGLRVRSNVDLPELFPATGAAAPDVTIELGSIPPVTRGEDDGLNQVDGALVLVIPEVGRYRIEAGNRITVESEPGVPKRNVRLFLLGSAFGVLLHQRGLLPLHANAVEIEGRAVAFMGESGAGKSTLAAWFHQQGDSVIADDVCVVGFDEGRPFAAPGLPRLRLWAEALELMGGDTANYDRSYVGHAASMEKFDVPIGRAATARSNVDLGALYLLGRDDEFSIARLSGMEAAEAVIANTYRGTYLSAVNGQQNHWQVAIKLVRDRPVYRVSRQWELPKLEDQCRRLREHAVGVVKNGLF